MKITTKFWLCISALVLGYLATVALNSVLSRHNEALLDRTAEVVFPSAQRAQSTQADFKRQMQFYQDAVVLGDSEALARANAIASDVRMALEELSGSDGLSADRKKQGYDLNVDLLAYAESAKAVYGPLAQGETDDGLMKRAATLNQDGERLLGRLDDFSSDLSDDLRGIIDATVTATVKQRAASEIAFVIIVLSTLAVILIIIAKWTRRLDDLIHASDRLGQGDYDCEIDAVGHDELGQLALGFTNMRVAVEKRDQELRTFNETLELQVRDRTRQLEEQKSDLELQISERHRAEQRIRLLDTAVAQIPEAVVITSAEPKASDQHIEYANQGFSRLMGMSKESSVTLSITALCGSGGCAALDAFIVKAIDGQPADMESQVRLSSQDRFLDIHAAPIRDDKGNVKNLVYIIRDITERKLMEAQRSQGQKLESIGQMAAGVAHEINTPIQFVGDNLRFLQDSFGDILHVFEKYGALRAAVAAAAADSVSAEVTNDLDEAVESLDIDYMKEEIPNAITQSLEGVDRVATIVRALKEFTHPEDNTMGGADLKRAIESTLNVSRNEYKYAAEMETDYDETMPPVECMVGELNQVVLNMVVNASHAIQDVVKDSGDRGVIRVSTKHDNGWAEIRISDTGGGMPDHVKARVFEPFFTTKEVGRGTGQGLYIAHEIIVKKHHGTLAIETEFGKGTTFIIRIPVAQELVNDEAAAKG